MTRMFTFQGRRLKTWNPFTGCNFGCAYCWARKLAEGKLKKAYPNGFVPEFHPDRLNVKFQPDDFVFVSSMGDLSYAYPYDLSQIMNVIKNHTETKFLFCTKNPTIYKNPNLRKDNIYLGTTLESNRDWGISEAPSPVQRSIEMMTLKLPHKFISIEPIMDFDLRIFFNWIKDIKPEIIEVGADNYHNNLPEPSPGKVNTLLAFLRTICPNVIEKDGLERLK